MQGSGSLNRAFLITSMIVRPDGIGLMVIACLPSFDDGSWRLGMSQTCMEAVPPVQSDTGCNRKQPVAAPRCALHMAKGPLGIGKRAARGQIPRYSDLDSEELGRDYIGDEIVV